MYISSCPFTHGHQSVLISASRFALNVSEMPVFPTNMNVHVSAPLGEVKEVSFSVAFIGKPEGVVMLMTDRISRYVNSQSSRQCCDSCRFFI